MRSYMSEKRAPAADKRISVTSSPHSLPYRDHTLVHNPPQHASISHHPTPNSFMLFLNRRGIFASYPNLVTWTSPPFLYTHLKNTNSQNKNKKRTTRARTVLLDLKPWAMAETPFPFPGVPLPCRRSKSNEKLKHAKRGNDPKTGI